MAARYVIAHRVAYLVGAALCLLTLPLTLIVLVIIFNPFGVVFIASFSIHNESGEAVYVTPIGAYGTNALRAVLPQYAVGFAAFPAFRSSNFRLRSGGSVRVHYDWDDINFSEIVVRDRAGQVKQLVIDPVPTEKQYHAPERDVFIVPPLKELAEASRPVLEALGKDAGSPFWLPWAMLLSLVGPPVGLFCLLRGYGRVKNAQSG
jgi:hypothetical protein